MTATSPPPAPSRSICHGSSVSFETAIIKRYRRRASRVEEALIETYLAGVSVRRAEDITEALWVSKVSPAAISELNEKAYVHTLGIGRISLCRVGATRRLKWTVSTCAAAGAESMKMWRFWW